MGKVTLHTQRCKGCYLCIRECPKKAIKKSGTNNKKGYEVIEVDDSYAWHAGLAMCMSGLWSLKSAGKKQL